MGFGVECIWTTVGHKKL